MIVIYCRISQDRTGEQLGVDRQLKDCRALAKRLGMKVDQVYTDNDISATNGKERPQFEAMLRARPSVVISWHQDRLLRLSSDLERVITLDVPVYTVTAGTLDLSTPAGRAVARTVAAWSTYEGEQKAVRQRAANIQRAEAGVWQFSRRPYGYERVGKRVQIVPAEAEVIREGFSRYLAGESYYAIANDWNARAVPTFGGPWSMSRVRSMLRNPAYAGERHYKGAHVGTGDWEPILERATWEAYTRMRAGRKRSSNWSTSTKHLLSGIIFCGVCGSAMLARPDRGRQVYSCTVNWCVSRGAADVEALVVGVVLARLADPGIIAGIRDEPDTAPLTAELGQLRARRDDLADLVADGLLDRVKARERATDLTARIEAVSHRLEAARADSPLTDLALAGSIPERWDALPLVARRQVIQALGLDVRVLKALPGRRPFDPATVVIEWCGGAHIDLDARTDTLEVMN